MKNIENMARGYKAAIHNRNVTNQGREHARDELDKLESRSRERSASQSSEGNERSASQSSEGNERSASQSSEGNEGNASYEEIRHDENVRRGLKAATHNPNVTDVGKQQARTKLEGLGEEPEHPAD